MSDKPARKPLVLMILDGWGYREETEANAIALGDTPCWDEMWSSDPHTLIETSGEAVGLPPGQMGNSEVGHLNIGAGRIVYQDYTRIDQAIRDGSFHRNTALCDGPNSILLNKVEPLLRQLLEIRKAVNRISNSNE